MRCKNCEGTNIIENIEMGKSNETGTIGPKFQGMIFTNVEPMFCDICDDCGEVVRIYVKNTHREKWINPYGWEK